MVHDIIIITKDGKIRRSYVVLKYTEYIKPEKKNLKEGWTLLISDEEK
jgi:hypothetical protein